MQRLAGWSVRLEGGVGALVLAMGVAHAAPPADVVIATPAEALAFSEGDAFVFAGQSLSVHSSFSTDRRIELERLAPVIVGADTHFALNGTVVSGAGAPRSAALEKRGLGTLTLSGENTYGSNTLLREGRLILSGASALGHRLYNLTQHAGTVLQLEAGTRVDNLLQLSAARPGDAALPGLDGYAEWRVDSGLATLGNNVNALIPVRKTGAGLLRLQGVLQGHSDLFIDAGALAVDDIAAARFLVGDGARLEGQGAFFQAHIHRGGMLAPGGRNAVATLSSWGNVVFEPGSVFHVNAYPDGRADSLKVGGTASLDGQVWVEAGEGDWATARRYSILTADGGLNGSQFGSVAANLAFLDPSLEYEPETVYLVLTRNGVGAGDLGETPGDQDAGDAIDPPEAEGRPLTPLQEAIRGMSVGQVQTLLRQSSGSWHASVRSMLLEDGRHVRHAVLAAGRDAWGEHAAGDQRLWSQAYAATGRRQSVGEVEGDQYRSRGVVLGLDAPAGVHWRPGLVLAAQHMGLDRTGGGASAKADTLHAGISAQGHWSGMRLTTALLRAWHRIDSRRQVSAGALHEWQRSSYVGRSWQAVLELAPQLRSLQAWGKRLRHGTLSLEPYLRHEWAHLNLPAQGETGGLMAHGVEASSSTLNATTLGWRMRYGWQGEGGPSWLEADLGWRRAWGSSQMHSTQHFVAAGRAGAAARSFTSQGQPLTRNALGLALEAGVAVSPKARLALRYSGLYGNGRQEHAAWADFSRAF